MKLGMSEGRDELVRKKRATQFLCLNFTAVSSQESPLDQYIVQYRYATDPASRGAAGARTIGFNASKPAQNNLKEQHKTMSKMVKGSNSPVREGHVRLYFSLPGRGFEPVEIPQEFDTGRRGPSKLAGKKHYNFDSKFDLTSLDEYQAHLEGELEGLAIEKYRGSPGAFGDVRGSVRVFGQRTLRGPLVILKPNWDDGILQFCPGCVEDVCNEMRGNMLSGRRVLTPVVIDEVLSSVSLCVENIESHDLKDEEELVSLEKLHDELNQCRREMGMEPVVVLDPIEVEMADGSPWLFLKA